jgi:hypothetical protein
MARQGSTIIAPSNFEEACPVWASILTKACRALGFTIQYTGGDVALSSSLPTSAFAQDRDLALRALASVEDDAVKRRGKSAFFSLEAYFQNMLEMRPLDSDSTNGDRHAFRLVFYARERELRGDDAAQAHIHVFPGVESVQQLRDEATILLGRSDFLSATDQIFRELGKRAFQHEGLARLIKTSQSPISTICFRKYRKQKVKTSQRQGRRVVEEIRLSTRPPAVVAGKDSVTLLGAQESAVLMTAKTVLDEALKRVLSPNRSRLSLEPGESLALAERIVTRAYAFSDSLNKILSSRLKQVKDRCYGLCLEEAKGDRSAVKRLFTAQLFSKTAAELMATWEQRPVSSVLEQPCYGDCSVAAISNYLARD